MDRMSSRTAARSRARRYRRNGCPSRATFRKAMAPCPDRRGGGRHRVAHCGHDRRCISGPLCGMSHRHRRGRHAPSAGCIGWTTSRRHARCRCCVSIRCTTAEATASSPACRSRFADRRRGALPRPSDARCRTGLSAVRQRAGRCPRVGARRTERQRHRSRSWLVAASRDRPWPASEPRRTRSPGISGAVRRPSGPYLRPAPSQQRPSAAPSR
jgi:hypothetical protein